MSELIDTYRRVQAMKEDPFEVPSEMVDFLAAQFRSEMGRPITAGELKVVLDGIAWTTRCVAEGGLDLEESLRVAEDLERNTRGNMARLPEQREADQLTIGIDAGFFTGLWVGLLLGK